MLHTLVDEDSLKNLEELFAFLVAGRVSVQTLIVLQIKAIKAGIMTEKMNQHSSDLIKKLQDTCAMYEIQMKDTLDLLPEDFNPEATIANLKSQQLKNALSMIKKFEEEKCDI